MEAPPMDFCPICFTSGKTGICRLPILGHQEIGITTGTGDYLNFRVQGQLLIYCKIQHVFNQKFWKTHLSTKFFPKLIYILWKPFGCNIYIQESSGFFFSNACLIKLTIKNRKYCTIFVKSKSLGYNIKPITLTKLGRHFWRELGIDKGAAPLLAPKKPRLILAGAP